jgi:hypothetical protein
MEPQHLIVYATYSLNNRKFLSNLIQYLDNCPTQGVEFFFAG